MPSATASFASISGSASRARQKALLGITLWPASFSAPTNFKRLDARKPWLSVRSCLVIGLGQISLQNKEERMKNQWSIEWSGSHEKLGYSCDPRLPDRTSENLLHECQPCQLLLLWYCYNPQGRTHCQDEVGDRCLSPVKRVHELVLNSS